MFTCIHSPILKCMYFWHSNLADPVTQCSLTECRWNLRRELRLAQGYLDYFRWLRVDSAVVGGVACPPTWSSFGGPDAWQLCVSLLAIADQPNQCNNICQIHAFAYTSRQNVTVLNIERYFDEFWAHERTNYDSSAATVGLWPINVGQPYFFSDVIQVTRRD